ncbi:hypothetical protein [Salinirarus marinus]|uniref:hypothetical protein n=1 Tax=Salinirarus marinus TaxID=3068310 RepID=UPI003C6C6887
MADAGDAGAATADATTTDPTAVPASDPLLAWGLASFHVAVLVVVPVAILHRVGALGSLLHGVGTGVGLALYLLLWGVTWATNRRWLTEADFSAPRPTVAAGGKWGAVAGLAFFYGLLVAIASATGDLTFVAIFALLGTAFSPLVGALIGVGFATLDLLVVDAARRVAAE